MGIQLYSERKFAEPSQLFKNIGEKNLEDKAESSKNLPQGLIKVKSKEIYP